MGFDERALFGLTSAGGAIYTIADITQEKTAELSQRQIAEEVQQRKTQQERFIDMISHEVRNPLSAILHCTEDILNAVHRIRNGAEHAGGDACDDCVERRLTSPTAEQDQACRRILSLGDEMTDENHQMTPPAIPEDPEVTCIEEINPACEDGRRTTRPK
ncbi:histidine kinase G2, putative [Aspergillus fumigatus Z5]|nr:histidine kinase G2, putative [Aspergillus fumigatus Z5]